MATENVWARLDRLIEELRAARLELDQNDDVSEPPPPQLRLIKGGA